MNWIKASIEEPNYYQNVTIKTIDGSILDDWHRLSDGDNEYYGSLNTDEIIWSEDITEWMPKV